MVELVDSIGPVDSIISTLQIAITFYDYRVLDVLGTNTLKQR
jgi:hypothetical protein